MLCGECVEDNHQGAAVYKPPFLLVGGL